MVKKQPNHKMEKKMTNKNERTEAEVVPIVVESLMRLHADLVGLISTTLNESSASPNTAVSTLMAAVADVLRQWAKPTMTDADIANFAHDSIERFLSFKDLNPTTRDEVESDGE